MKQWEVPYLTWYAEGDYILTHCFHVHMKTAAFCVEFVDQDIAARYVVSMVLYQYDLGISQLVNQFILVLLCPVVASAKLESSFI